jgi:HD-like signal output (HDOD) protein
MISARTASAEETLQRRLGGISNLPTPPLVFTQINKVINDPMTSAAKIAAIMSEDPAMTAKVLRLSNSAYFGARSEITHIRQAVVMLGLDAVKSLVLSSSVFDMFKNRKVDSGYQESFWRHSLATGLGARLVVRQTPGLSHLDPEVAFSAGLLHDIGKLVVCCFMPEEHEKIAAYVAEQGCSDYEAERAVLDFNHALAGRILGSNWKLPVAMLKAIEFHHEPLAATEDGADYAQAVHIGNYLAVRVFDDSLLKRSPASYRDDDVTTMLALDDEALEKLADKLLDEYSRSSTFLQMAMAG